VAKKVMVTWLLAILGTKLLGSQVTMPQAPSNEALGNKISESWN